VSIFFRPHPCPKMEPKLFVGNLPTRITEEAINQVFKLYGIIERIVMIDKVGNSGARSCFVIYHDHPSCQRAIAALHSNFTFPGGGERIVARYADSAKGERGGPRPLHPHWGFEDRGPTPSPGEPKLFVGNLPPHVTEEALTQLFGEFGTLDWVVMMEKPSPSGARSAFVLYNDFEASIQAIASLHSKYIFPGSTDAIVVRYADSTRNFPRDFNVAHWTGQAAEAKLFVGNLPEGAPEEALHTLMSHFGEVVHIHMMSNPTTSGAVCAFVLYANPASCQPAIDALSGVFCFPPRETPMTVAFARRPGGPPGHTPSNVDQPLEPDLATPTEYKLFVGNLPLNITQEALRTMFLPFGNLVEAFLFKRGPETAKGAFVRFSDLESAQSAIRTMNGQEVGGKRIVVQPARSPRQSGDTSHSQFPAPEPAVSSSSAIPMTTLAQMQLLAAQLAADQLAPYYAAYSTLASQLSFPQVPAQSSSIPVLGHPCLTHNLPAPRGLEEVTIHLQNLPPHLTDASVASMSSMFGSVVSCSIAPEVDGRSASGTVTFSSSSSAMLAAKTMDGLEIGPFKFQCAMIKPDSVYAPH